jgi:DNA-directed RNA polymerase subunit K/omega
MAVRPVNIDKFTRSADSLYEAVVIISKRARQIHQDLRIEFEQRKATLEQLTGTTETEEELESIVNPDQLKISLEFEARPKPTEMSLDELAQKKLTWRYKETAPQASEEKKGEEVE